MNLQENQIKIINIFSDCNKCDDNKLNSIDQCKKLDPNPLNIISPEIEDPNINSPERMAEEISIHQSDKMGDDSDRLYDNSSNNHKVAKSDNVDVEKVQADSKKQSEVNVMNSIKEQNEMVEKETIEIQEPENINIFENNIQINSCSSIYHQTMQRINIYKKQVIAAKLARESKLIHDKLDSERFQKKKAYMNEVTERIKVQRESGRPEFLRNTAKYGKVQRY